MCCPAFTTQHILLLEEIHVQQNYTEETPNTGSNKQETNYGIEATENKKAQLTPRSARDSAAW